MKQTLKQAAEEWMHESDDDNGIPVTSWAWSDVIDAFKAGAEWQKKQDELTWEDIEMIDVLITRVANQPPEYADASEEEREVYSKALELFKKYKEQKNK